MALPTYLTLVNNVLSRLREPTVSTVNENTLSALVGRFINDGKKYVEDAYDWNCLSVTTTINTVASTYSNYSLAGAGQRFKIYDVYNASNRYYLRQQDSHQFRMYVRGIAVPSAGFPSYYNMQGVDANGDPYINFFPVPNGAYAIEFNLKVPQLDLAADSDVLQVPAPPVEEWAYARALVERGEDQGINSSEAFKLAEIRLGDAIALESGRFGEEECWEAK
jgi:hypothetical protein